jgi:tight adherence protein C
VREAARRLDVVLGGRSSLVRRLERAGSSASVEEFRLEQLVWGAAGFGGAFALLLVLLARGSSVPVVVALVLCCCAAAAGVLGREQLLNHRVAQREERIAAEFPAVAELLALAVAAGEGAAGAISRVARVCSGELAGELTRVLDDTRTGRGLGDAMRAFAVRVDLTSVSRFVEGVLVAVERGTPLADVLHAQAADARELRRRQLMETAGRREIAMLVPVVFLILPVTVLVALFPGFYGLSLSVA